MKTSVFVGLMAIVPLMSLAKLFALASTLTPVAFAGYSAYFALALLPSNLLSFGIVEGSTKQLTRMATAGEWSQLATEVARILRVTGLRLGALGAITAALVIWGGLDLTVSLAVLLLVATALHASMLASLIRALGDLHWLIVFNFLRVALSSAVAVWWSIKGEWQSVLLAEAVVGAAVVLVTWLPLLARKLRDVFPFRALLARPRLGEFLARADMGGLALFWAFFLASVPLSADRYFVLKLSDPVVAKQYAFLAIWITGAYTFVSIVVQKFGPETVRSELAKDDRSQIAGLLRLAVAVSAFLSTAALASFVAVGWLFPVQYWERFQLNTTLCVTVSALCALQVSQLFDWVLISFDREKDVLVGAACFLLLVALSFGMVAALRGGAIHYVGALALARIVQLAGQWWLIRRALVQRR